MENTKSTEGISISQSILSPRNYIFNGKGHEGFKKYSKTHLRYNISDFFVFFTFYLCELRG